MVDASLTARVFARCRLHVQTGPARPRECSLPRSRRHLPPCHTASQVAAVMGEGRHRDARDRADNIMWALDAGLVDEQNATALNRGLAAVEAGRARSRSSEPGAYRVKSNTPFALLPCLFRRRLAVEFDWVNMAPAGPPLGPDSLVHAFQAFLATVPLNSALWLFAACDGRANRNGCCPPSGICSLLVGANV